VSRLPPTQYDENLLAHGIVRPLAPDEEAVLESALRRSGAKVNDARGQVEWMTIAIPMLAEIQRNADGTWTGMVRRLSRAVLTCPTREELLETLIRVHSREAPK
jgi:hypothetical protein